MTHGLELHRWPHNTNEALQIQEDLRGRVKISESRLSPVKITAVDTAHDAVKDILYASAVTVSFPDLRVIERTWASEKAAFDYIPTLRSFREGPVIIKALMSLKQEPDLLIFPGHGIAHPKRFGLASHLGLWIDKPSIGCARKWLAGQFDPPGDERGDISYLSFENEKAGIVIRSRRGVKPIFVSPGHLCGIENSLHIIRACLGEYRLPIPLRLAHLHAAKMCRITSGMEGAKSL